MRIAFALAALLTLVSCSPAPKPGVGDSDSKTGPAVKVRQLPTKAMVRMSDPTLDDYIVKDVGDTLEAKTWRWSYERPEFRFQLKQATGQKLEVHFAVAGATFKTTGPVTIKFLVNNKPIGTMKVLNPGEQLYSKAVPADLLRTDALTDVAIEARPFWTSGTDGRHLTLILTQVGFLDGAAKK
jgi:hypothetical protein